MVKRCGMRWVWTTAAVLGMLATAAVFAQPPAQPPAQKPAQPPAQPQAQQPLLWAPKVKGDSRPIQVSADEAAAWVDAQGKRVILLKGKVWIEQGDAHIRASQAVLWVDEPGQKRTGIYHVDLYSDGGVSLEIGPQTYEAPLSMIELETRGVINLKTFKAKVVQKAQPEDPLYQRGTGALKQPMAKPAQPSGTPTNKTQQSFKMDFGPALKTEVVRAQAPDLTQPPPVPMDMRQLDALAPVPTRQAAEQNPPQPPQQQIVLTPELPAGPPGTPTVTLAAQPKPGDPVVPVEKPATQFSLTPRTSQPLQVKPFPMDKEQAIVITGGAIIRIVAPYVPKVTVQGAPPPANGVPPPIPEVQIRIIEIAADRVVAWTRGGLQDLMDDAPPPEPVPGQPAKAQPAHDYEFYFSGNVEIRQTLPKKYQGKDVVQPVDLRCKEAYYDYSPAALATGDPGRNVAIILDTDLQVRQPGLPDPVRIVAPVARQLNESIFEFDRTETSASKLTYGPGLYTTTGEASLESKHVLKQTIFGSQYLSRQTGEPEYEDQLIFRGWNVVVWLEGIPVFWLPYLQGDARDPLGPLRSLSIGYSNNIFGFEFMTSWNVFDLIGIDPILDTGWTVDFDYMSLRGPAMASEFNSHGKGLFGISGNYSVDIKGMIIHDDGVDVLGGNRGQEVIFGNPPGTVLPITHPDWRGRLYAEFNWQELPYNLTLQTKLGIISDNHFLDQYYNPEWLNGPNQETFFYVKQQDSDWAWTFNFEPRIRNWITETEVLPAVQGFWIGQDFLDAFNYTARASAGYYRLETTHQQPMAFEPTDISEGTGRVDFWQELALPFQLGAFKVVPYGIFDMTYYSEDINGNEDFRTLGGGGVRGSIPFSRLYPDVCSELFNLDGIYHKIVLSGDYSWVHSDRSHYLFPQLDRLNDDASDQALRDIRPQQFAINPANAIMLNSGFFDPQLFALRKLVDASIDTLDSMEVLTLDVRQRWQTKRGYPGQEHVIDWMTLEVSASIFPQADRDDFGKTLNFYTYDWTWNIGDRTTLFSGGWFDPHDGGARVWSFGTQFNRPDGSALSVGYRQIDPLDSKQVIASLSVPFSSKYTIGAATSYDFGTNTQINTLTVTRTGTDLVVSLGLTYNSVLSNFGFMFEIYPNLFPATKNVPGFGNGTMGH